MMVLVEQLEYKARYDGFLFVLAANNSEDINKKPNLNADSHSLKYSTSYLFLSVAVRSLFWRQFHLGSRLSRYGAPRALGNR